MWYDVFHREGSGNRQIFRIHGALNRRVTIDGLNPSTRHFITVQTRSRGDFPVVRSDESEELVGFTGKF